MEERMNLRVDYQPEGDLAYIFLGAPYPTINFEFDQNFTLRFDPKNKALIGLMIHQYSELYPMSKRADDMEKVCSTIFSLFNQLLQEKKLKEPIPA